MRLCTRQPRQLQQALRPPAPCRLVRAALLPAQHAHAVQMVESVLAVIALSSSSCLLVKEAVLIAVSCYGCLTFKEVFMSAAQVRAERSMCRGALWRGRQILELWQLRAGYRLWQTHCDSTVLRQALCSCWGICVCVCVCVCVDSCQDSMQ